jgi:hypothetical protein
MNLALKARPAPADQTLTDVISAPAPAPLIAASVPATRPAESWHGDLDWMDLQEREACDLDMLHEEPFPR